MHAVSGAVFKDFAGPLLLMPLTLDLRKSARENLSELYAQLRSLKDKRAGLHTALTQTRKELDTLQAASAQPPAPEKAPAHSSPSARPPSASAGSSASKKSSSKTKWTESYLSFLTSGGKLVVAGHNAKQNDELYAKRLSPGDLFFHADIQGAPTVILKEGQKAGEAERREAAQWAASYSSAWKTGVAAVDVYAVTPEQVSKNASGGYVGRGAFAIEGERQWFRQTPLQLKIGLRNGIVAALPAIHPDKLEHSRPLSPGPKPKEEIAKALSSIFSRRADEISTLLPAGKFASV